MNRSPERKLSSVKKKLKGKHYLCSRITMEFLKKEIPPYLRDKINVLKQIVFAALFALVFINIYSPFNADAWFSAGDVEFFFYSSLFILAGMLFIVVSRLIFITIGDSIHLTYWIYILWNLLEILLLALVYTLMDLFLLDNPGDLAVRYFKLLFVTLMVLAIPYAISWLYFAWKDQKSQLHDLMQENSREFDQRRMINFYDESGKLRFTIDSGDVLYIESTDNYATIIMQDKQRRKKLMLRNTMKRLEKELEKTTIIRCHRSYMVNFDNVKMVRLYGTSLYVYMDTEEEIKLPVSRTYAEKVHEFMNRLSLS